VFVDLHRPRVVRVLPWPLDSEGSPPTSVPPFTLPASFAPGSDDATPVEVAARSGWIR
jgi:hypothetical protein